MWPVWAYAAGIAASPRRREATLSTYAPLYLVLLLVAWTGLLVVGYGLMFYGLRAHLDPPDLDLGSTLYFAGTTLFTMAYGDITPRGAPARMLAVMTGANGFAVVAVVTTYLFTLFAAFQRREEFVVRLGSLAGSPPSGAQILIDGAGLGMHDAMGSLFERAQDWCANLFETHLAYPTLTYFRSNEDGQSWIAALGAMMDAATLAISTTDDRCGGEARLFYRLSIRLVGDLARSSEAVSDGRPGIERAEYDDVRKQLGLAGYTLIDAEAGWDEFSRLRSAYASQLNALAHYWRIPPARWIGDHDVTGAGAPPKTS